MLKAQVRDLQAQIAAAEQMLRGERRSKICVLLVLQYLHCMHIVQVQDLQAQVAAAEQMLSGERSSAAELRENVAGLKVGAECAGSVILVVGFCNNGCRVLQ